MSNPRLLSVITPVWNEVSSIEPFLNRLLPVLDNLEMDYEVIFALDPSTDGTEQEILRFRQSDSRIKVLVFSRRFGQANATMAGLEHSIGDAVVVIDVDLQDPPEIIPELVREWEAGNEVVMAKRTGRPAESPTRRILAKLGYRFLDKFSEVPIPREAGDFRLMSRRVVDELNEFKEHSGFLRGLVAWVGFQTAEVEFPRDDRFAGDTKYNKVTGSLQIGLNGIVGFSSALLNLSVVLGISFAGGSIVIAIVYGLTKLFGYGFPLGNPTIVISIYMIGGLILLANGVLGLYVSQIFREVKRRPRFIVSKKVGF